MMDMIYIYYFFQGKSLFLEGFWKSKEEDNYRCGKIMTFEGRGCCIKKDVAIYQSRTCGITCGETYPLAVYTLLLMCSVIKFICPCPNL